MATKPVNSAGAKQNENLNETQNQNNNSKNFARWAIMKLLWWAAISFAVFFCLELIVGLMAGISDVDQINSYESPMANYDPVFYHTFAMIMRLIEFIFGIASIIWLLLTVAKINVTYKNLAKE